MYAGLFCNNSRFVFSVQTYPVKWKPFPEGELMFEVEHRSGELAVWLRGQPDKVASVPIVEPSDELRVLPFEWTTDMPVEFSGK